MRKLVITPRGTLPPTTVQRWTRICGMGESTRRQRAEGEGNNASQGENAMADELGFEGKKDEGYEDKGQCGVADGQDIERENGEHDEKKADYSGDDCAGMIEFDVRAEQSDGEQHEGHVGIHEERKDLLFNVRSKTSGAFGSVQDDFTAVEAA